MFFTKSGKIMRKVIIYKDKVTSVDWDETLKEWVEFEIKDIENELPKYLNRIVQIHSDVIVEDFFNFLYKCEKVIDSFFYDFSKGQAIKLYIDEMNSNSVETDLEEVEMMWEGEVLNGDLAILGYLRGWLNEAKMQELNLDYEVPHDISFLPVFVWKKCKFSLNENLDIANLGTNTEMKREVFFEGYYRWTLFELISNFLAEITVNGSPEQRDVLFSQLENRKYDIEEVLKSKERQDFWILFLESELAELNYAMTNALEEENYETASTIKTELESVQKELDVLREEIKKVNGKRKK